MTVLLGNVTGLVLEREGDGSCCDSTRREWRGRWPWQPVGGLGKKTNGEEVEMEKKGIIK